MLTKTSLICLLLPFVFIACEKDKEPVYISTDPVVGSWVNPQYSDTIETYRRVNGLVDNQYGFTLKQDHRFIERKNAGWCGTPPVVYADYQGTWEENDSIVLISVGFWGGTVDYKWKILSTGKDRLTIVRTKADYHMEEK